MEDIKSTRAKEQITELQEEYNPATIMDIIDVVEFAEKDAEERAKNALKRVLDFNGGVLSSTDKGAEFFITLFDMFYNDKI